MERKRKKQETDNIPGTSSTVEDAGLASADVRKESSNFKDPVDMVEDTAIAPNVDGANTNAEDPGDSQSVEDADLSPATVFEKVDTPRIGDENLIQVSNNVSSTIDSTHKDHLE